MFAWGAGGVNPPPPARSSPLQERLLPGEDEGSRSRETGHVVDRAHAGRSLAEGGDEDAAGAGLRIRGIRPDRRGRIGLARPDDGAAAGRRVAGRARGAIAAQLADAALRVDAVPAGVVRDAGGPGAGRGARRAVAVAVLGFIAGLRPRQRRCPRGERQPDVERGRFRRRVGWAGGREPIGRAPLGLRHGHDRLDRARLGPVRAGGAGAPGPVLRRAARRTAGQTLVWSEMRWTSENRLTWIGVVSDTSPVWTFSFP